MSALAGGGLSVCPLSLFRPLPRWWLAQAILAVRATLRNSQERERAAADDDNDDDDGDDANGSYCEIRPPHPLSCFSWPCKGETLLVVLTAFCRRLSPFLVEKFSGANFCFLAFGSGRCFLVLFCLCFCFIMWHCSPESRLINSLIVRCAFWKKFSGANFCNKFCFLTFVPGWCFWCCFAYVFALLCGIVLPKVA